MRLSIGGRPFRIIGTDGGLIPAPFVTSEVLLGPADRVDLAVGPFPEGETLQVESLRFSRGKLAVFPRREPFATLRVGPAAPSRAEIPEVLRRIEPIVTGPVEPTREVRFGWKLSRAHGVDFTINKESHHRAEPCKVGELQVWDIVNGCLVRTRGERQEHDEDEHVPHAAHFITRAPRDASAISTICAVSNGGSGTGRHVPQDDRPVRQRS